MVEADETCEESGIWTDGKKSQKKTQPRFVACVDNSGYLASLELHKIYRVVPAEDAAQDGDIRIVDESGKDYLYSADRFIVIDVPKL